jgi:hypothetical protein
MWMFRKSLINFILHKSVSSTGHNRQESNSPTVVMIGTKRKM